MFTWSPQGRRKRNTWHREVEAEMIKAGYKWKELEAGTKNQLMAHAPQGSKKTK